MAIVLERSKHCFRLVESETNQTELAFRGSSVTLKSQEGPETYFCHWDVEENNPGQVQIFRPIESAQAVCDFADSDGESMDDLYESESGWDEDDEDGDGEDTDVDVLDDEESDDADEDDAEDSDSDGDDEDAEDED